MNRDELVEKLKHQLDELNGEIDELEVKMQNASADTRAQYDEKVSEARAEAERAQAKLKELRDEGEDRWEELREEAEYAWKALRNSVNYFRSHFR